MLLHTNIRNNGRYLWADLNIFNNNNDNNNNNVHERLGLFPVP